MTRTNHTTGATAGSRGLAKASVLEIVVADLAGATDSLVDLLSRLGQPDSDAATAAMVADKGLWGFGPVATEWTTLDRAFVGAPGTGRSPGPIAKRPPGDPW